MNLKKPGGKRKGTAGPDLRIPPTLNMGARIDLKELALVVRYFEAAGIRVESKSQIIRQVFYDACRTIEKNTGQSLKQMTYKQAADILTEHHLEPPPGHQERKYFDKAYIYSDTMEERGEALSLPTSDGGLTQEEQNALNNALMGIMEDEEKGNFDS